jgi:MYXO-CTERM domain-containing protein
MSSGVTVSVPFLSLLLALETGVAHAHESMIFDVVPGENWCDVINSEAMPGDIIRLASGEYLGPCLIDRAPDESQQEYTQVISLDPENPARIVYDGSSDTLIQVRGEQIMLVALVFEGLPEAVPAVEVLGERAIWIQHCDFSNLPGIAISVTGAVNGLYMLHNSFEQVQTAFDLQLNAEKTVLDIGGNLFQEVGKMVSIQGDWTGSIRNNIAQNVAQGVVVGPGEHPAALKIDGNWIQSPGAAIRIETGPALLRNNILQGSGLAWDLGLDNAELQDVRVLGNSFLGTGDDLFKLRGSASEVVFANNLSLGAFPKMTGVVAENNGLCTEPSDCWQSPATGGFYPTQGAQGLSSTDLREDFCGRVRADSPTWGALEPACPQDPLQFEVGFKDSFSCTFALIGDNADCRIPGDTNSGDTGTPTVDPTVDPEGCGCRTTPRQRGLWAVLGAVAVIGVRRKLRIGLG